MRRLQAIRPMISGMVALLVLTLNSVSFGQSSNSPFHSSPSNAPSQQNPSTYAPVGPSGYKVLIPEIKMNQIVGDVKKKPTTNIPPEHGAPELEPVPAPQPGPVPDESVEKEAPEQHVETPQQPAEGIPSEAVKRLPFDHGDRKSPTPNDKEDIEQNVKDGIERESHMFGPPLAPINITEALPEPTKEVLGKRQPLITPKLKELEILKNNQKVNSVEVLQDQGSLAPEDWVLFQARKDADQLPFEGPKLGPAEKTVQSEKPGTKESQTQEASESGVENIAHPPGETTAPTLEKEEQPIKETQDIGTSAPEGRIKISPPPKEQVPSPLDETAVNETDLRMYLSQTAPVLEGLSLLMARAPSLNLADYDPSEMNTPAMPQDLGLKLESLKRDLRILDSKVFSIIPPSKYEQFHELIRQSISHTYLACEAISNYFQDAKPEDLQKVKEHLARAKELIQLTRRRNSSG